MDTASINSLTKSVTIYTPYIILIFSNFGCIGNFITFTSKQLRQNSCGWYFLMSALFDFLFINFGLFTKLANLNYGSTLQNTNLAWCRIHVFLTWVLPCISIGYVLLASIDRCLSTSQHIRLRSFSQIKVAYRMTCIPIILYSFTTSHQLVFYKLQPACSPTLGIYSYFLSIYSILWPSLIPQGTMFIFGLIAYCNVKRIRRRVFHPQISQRKRVDFQMITITLFQVLCSSILLNIRTVYFAYTLFSSNIPKSSYQSAVEALFMEITSLIFYINFGKSFFVNTLTSKLFRKVFRERLLSFYRVIVQRNVRIHPNHPVRRFDQTKLVNKPIQYQTAVQTIG